MGKHYKKKEDDIINKVKTEELEQPVTISPIGDNLFMNVQKLQIGQEVKNYKELCNILNQPVKVGKSKTLQLEDFKSAA